MSMGPSEHGSQSATDRDAEFAAIALPLLPAVARIARSLTHDAADADDLVQDTFLKAYRHWGTFVAGEFAHQAG